MGLQLKRAEKRRRTHNETNTEVRIGICKACGRGPRQVHYEEGVCADRVWRKTHYELMRPLPCVDRVWRKEHNALRNQ
jgi:hypothetical protein